MGNQSTRLAPFWSHFPSKIDEQFEAKIDVEKVVKINEMSMQNGLEIDLKFNTFRKLVS